MHIIIGILGSIVTILYLLNRLGNLGIDFSWLNPFHWRHRRAWAKKYEGDPIYTVEDPMQVAALLIIGAAKIGGDLTVGQKKVAIKQFESRFSLSESDALDFLGSAVHLLAAPQIIENQLDGLADKNTDRFTAEQAESMVEMMVAVTSSDGESSVKQRAYIDRIRSRFVQTDESPGTWS